MQAQVRLTLEGLTAHTAAVVEPELVWDWVGPLIQDIIEKCDLSCTLDQVFEKVANGQSLLWVNEYGFVITEIHICQYTDEKTLFFWLAGAKKIGLDCVGALTPFFETVARARGYKYLEVSSPVLEMMQHLPKSGWQIDSVVYRKKL